MGKKMYEQLAAITQKYGSAFFLRQSMHPFNTQSNEALNYSQSCLTPKAKSFHESRSFHYRHAIVVGSHNWGIIKYWSHVFGCLGISLSPNFLHYLTTVQMRRRRWEQYQQKPEIKRKRAYKQDAAEKRLLYENRTSEYGAGIGLDIGYT